MSRLRRGLLAVMLGVAAASCGDSMGLNVPDGRPLQFSVVGPQSVSQAEIDALGSAFDQVDEYAVIIVDAATLDPIADTVIAIVSGGTVHTLGIEVDDGALGRSARITLIALSNGVELYRSVTTAVLGTDPSDTIPLTVRYSGPGIRGTVSDQTGAPVGGVNVELSQGQSILPAVTTEEDGTYLFADVLPGSYAVQPSPASGAPFICPGFRDVVVASDASVIVADFVTSSTVCGTSVLVVSGGDFDDTGLVAVRLTNDPNLTVSTFFYVNQLPGVATLSQYDVVLLLMNGLFDESAALGTEVADYVALGGNVVLSSFYWQGRSDSGLGSIGWGALETIDPFASLGGATYQAVTLDANSVVAHSLTLGVTAVSSTSYSSGVSALTGTTVVASWDDGAPFIGYKILAGGQRIVGVSLFPAAGGTATGDIQAVWENALNWAGAAGGPALR